MGVNTLRPIREHRLASTESIGELLNAGTNCGSCVPELRSSSCRGCCGRKSGRQACRMNTGETCQMSLSLWRARLAGYG